MPMIRELQHSDMTRVYEIVTITIGPIGVMTSSRIGTASTQKKAALPLWSRGLANFKTSLFRIGRWVREASSKGWMALFKLLGLCVWTWTNVRDEQSTPQSLGPMSEEVQQVCSASWLVNSCFGVRCRLSAHDHLVLSGQMPQLFNESQADEFVVRIMRVKFWSRNFHVYYYLRTYCFTWHSTKCRKRSYLWILFNIIS